MFHSVAVETMPQLVGDHGPGRSAAQDDEVASWLSPVSRPYFDAKQRGYLETVAKVLPRSDKAPSMLHSATSREGASPNSRKFAQRVDLGQERRQQLLRVGDDARVDLEPDEH